MSMSRKDFIALANGLGNTARLYGFTRTGFQTGAFIDAVDAVMDACESANYAFSRSTFLSHLWDIAEGRRDSQGRKVKVSA